MKIIDGLVKLLLIAAAFSVIYHYLIYLPRLDTMKAEAAKQKSVSAANQEKARKYAYQVCLYNAQTEYSSEWADQCKHIAAAIEQNIQNCRVNYIMLTPAQCAASYGKPDPSPNCFLPAMAAKRLNDELKQANDTCLKQARAQTH